MTETESRLIRKSLCCSADLENLAEPIIERKATRLTYYYHRCFYCKELTRTKDVQLFGSDGVEVMPGELLFCPEADEPWQYHAVYLEGGELVIRDLNANNVYTWTDPCYSAGPYWRHLDKLTDDDLAYYWNTTRAAAERCLANDLGAK